MALTAYKKKRSFTKTPEPEGGKAKSGGLRFVIQKHAATNLHYDFRLEMQGVLKSWAVPKGPSTNPAEKRLAMMVEDHPYDYRDFEGIIPKGQYGGGTVIIWDEGFYEPIEKIKGKKEQEKILLKQLRSGSLKIILHGSKLKGEFALVHMAGRGENAWLLIKHKDQYAKATDITRKNKSVQSGKTIEQIAKKPQHVYGQAEKKSKTAQFLNSEEDQQTKTIKGHEMVFNHITKYYWPKEKITKGDMLNYYAAVAPYMLPYMKNRPQSLNRNPGGISGQAFYQKDMTNTAPDWVEQFPYRTEDGKNRHFMVCQSEADILYMASLGCIEMNPWSSTVKKPDYPDWCIIDLDPGTETSFNQVIEAANITRQVLEMAKITGYCKTSGSTGLHIYIPLGAKYNYDQSKEFARLIVTIVHDQLPGSTSLERTVASRKGKLYLDFLQNRPGATLATVYSLRPKPGATVSMPLHWDEVKPGLKMSDFTISNALDRIREVKELFKPVLGKGIDLKAVLATLSSGQEST
jgi:DNA ligase D-like protein (predicted polymerase)/DNA ligase D-like protein (predicted 3'-phosphoesterase)